jgi:hypothetical protein
MLKLKFISLKRQAAGEEEDRREKAGSRKGIALSHLHKPCPCPLVHTYVQRYELRRGVNVRYFERERGLAWQRMGSVKVAEKTLLSTSTLKRRSMANGLQLQPASRTFSAFLFLSFVSSLNKSSYFSLNYY